MSRIQSNPTVVYGGVIYGNYASTTITANTNDLLINGIDNSVLIRASSTGNYSLTGIVINDTTQAKEIVFFNIGLNNITLKNNDAGSLSQNRFIIGADKIIQPNEGISFIYDPVSLRWRSQGVNI